MSEFSHRLYTQVWSVARTASAAAAILSSQMKSVQTSFSFFVPAYCALEY